MTEEDDAEASVLTATDAGNGDKATVDTGTRSDSTLADAVRSSSHSDSWDLDDILDSIEAEADRATAGFADALPPVSEGATAPCKRYRLRPEAALAAVRLAATFGSADAMVRALGAPGAVTLITTSDPAIDSISSSSSSMSPSPTRSGRGARRSPWSSLPRKPGPPSRARPNRLSLPCLAR
ncbi:hypothetical protein MCRY_14435 [Marivita cryptomonadis]|nr:hypothetical protein MCRY_14435 [Marivita cryptomonadis]